MAGSGRFLAKSRQIRNAEKNVILNMLMDTSTDIEIISITGLPSRTYYRYKEQIYKDCAKVFEEQKLDNIGFHIEQLNNRLTEDLKVIKSKLAEANGRDAAALAQVKIEIEKTIFDLQVQGMEFLDKVKSLNNRTHRLIVEDSSNTNGSNTNGHIPESV